MDTPHPTIVEQIDAFLTEHSMSPITFGRKVMGDPHFVRDLRGGRDIRMSTAEKILDFIQRYSPEVPPPFRTPSPRHRRTAPREATA